jgi:hypothetical protein
MMEDKSLAKQGAILLATYSRPDELEKCLKSLTNQLARVEPVIVVIFQRGNIQVQRVLEKFRQDIHYLFETDALGTSPLENINFNRILGYELCFEYLKFDWVLAVEEDIVISNDSFEFCNEAMTKYWKHPLFRGVNLGSFEKMNVVNKHTYSLISYGMHGQASAITKFTWDRLPKDRLRKSSSNDGFDGQVENFLKIGFFVTPNSSRYLDYGWNGTHASQDKRDNYYQLLRESWAGDVSVLPDNYLHMQVTHNWRADALKFGFQSVTTSIVKNFLINLKRKLRIIMETN